MAGQPKQAAAQEKTAGAEGSFSIKAPAVSLPKGGGAIRGMGEKFAANPVTGTGSMTLPIATSPGRSGFGPQLSLSYDSGAGNGPFGFGWNLSLPSITRKTDKGLPTYRDAEESDVFILSGAEDLVPEYEKDAAGNWVFKDGKHVIHDKPRTVDGVTYNVRRYRPRIEGLFARIERWTNQADPTDVFWRSISKDNITTWYGKPDNSRIADPLNRTRIFSWLICQSYDDKGNVIVYRYKEEDSGNLDQTQANERNRTTDTRKANRYLKRISYGNRVPYLPVLTETKWPQPPDQNPASGPPNYYFEVVFDYEDGHYTEAAPDAEGRVFAESVCDPPASAKWTRRVDPFSTYRAGFEVRTYRLCQRVLMFHHFPNELGVPDYLVRSTDFTYSYENNPTAARNPIYSFLDSVTQSGYVRQTNGSYLKKSLPPVQFEYTQPIVQDRVEVVDAASLENLPAGLDGAAYQWTDLHGEGIPSILTEQGGAWFYKRNLSPINEQPRSGHSQVEAKFAPVELVAVKPTLALAAGAQFMDLAGDGQPDLVVLDSAMPGLYEHDEAEGWQPFRPFSACLHRDMRDPNLKFVDVDGDGHADILITEDAALVWHASQAEAGFGPARRVAPALDEEKGPRLVFADGTQSIYLADLSGDGLTDLVRIRNREVCYWPNLGYGRFGVKVTMDNAPHFDTADQFDQKRIRLADIDGSGTTDIIYLHCDGVRLYFNQSGNSWSAPRNLNVFPRVDDHLSIVPTDLLGNGTACLVWSSPLPGDTRRPMRYINLMGGQKPHLLVKTINNLGAETQVQYAPSTKFYLQDKRAGKPWITRLPFPVHVVEKVTVTDKWRGTRFSSTYSYHHGYFDGVEREFRGFGRVEQIDVENYGKFASGNEASPYITQDQTLYQPPVKTMTWFHTGACTDRMRAISQLEHEYFPNWLAEAGYSIHPDYDFSERALPEPDLITQGLSTDEWREAMRACKGMMLRQEAYELDVDALTREQPEEVPVRLFSAAVHNCQIQRLQPHGLNRHAVFLVTESEALTYHYELDMRSRVLTPDPRIAHTLNLTVNEYGQPLQTVAVAYPRVRPFQNTDPTTPTFPAGLQELVRNVQNELHLAYTETRYTDDFGDRAEDREKARDNYRLRLPCEVMTYELTGIRRDDEGDRATTDPWDDIYFTLDELRAYRLSERVKSTGILVHFLQYHLQPTSGTCQKRIVEHVRMLFFKDDPADPRALQDPLPSGTMSRLGLAYETYKLALTKDLLDRVLVDPARLTRAYSALDAQANGHPINGYYKGDRLFPDDPVTSAPPSEQYWMGTGIAGFNSDAAQHFYLPERYTDPFGNVTTVAYDGNYDLYIQSSTDAAGNTSRVERFDYRVLAPSVMKDLNDNLSEVMFDTLGMPVAMAAKGKGSEGDSLTGFDDALCNPDLNTIIRFFTGGYDETAARRLLGNATARYLYYFGEEQQTGRPVTYGHHPACAGAVLRERHVAQLGTGELSPLQTGFEYSDGMGTVLVKKAQAEPQPGSTGLRWIASGKTILNNKGKPVKQYEPYFSTNEHRFEETQEVGVSPLMYYDAVGRLMRTELPDGSFSRVEFSPWHVQTFNQNDTVLESQWYEERGSPDPNGTKPTDPDQRAAWLAAQHANTPSVIHLDSLSRDVVAVAHNRYRDASNTVVNEKYVTFTKLDAEGKPLWIRDARGNLVMQYITPPKPTRLADTPRNPSDPSDNSREYLPSGSVPCYDIAGNLLYQHSMDVGDRWMINDAAGKPMLAWDINETPQGTASTREDRLYATDYDQLHRPTALWLTTNGASPIMVERYEYQDAVSHDLKNLNGQLVRHYDPSGLAETIRRDFKGNMQQLRRTLNNRPDQSVIDWQHNPNATLESQTYTQLTEYDALNRIRRLYHWHLQADNRVTIYEPRYNERGVLVSEDLVMRAPGYNSASGTRTSAIQEICYNAKGQKEYLKLGNGTLTQYEYDPKTFRLKQIQTTRPADPSGFPQRRSNLQDAGIVQQLLYTYDPVGNITEVEDQAYKPVFFQNAIVEPKNLYEYDALYRLRSGTGRENGASVGAPTHIEGTVPEVVFPVTNPNALRRYTQRYQYDSVGNILQMRHEAGVGSWTRDYAYAFEDRAQPASNRLWQTWTGGDRTQAITYGYDTHGNMLNLANVAPGQHLQWDHRDMIKSIDLVGGGTAYYQYDSGKQRTRKRIVNQNGTGYWERIYLGGFERYRRYEGTTLKEDIESHHLVEVEQRVLLVDDVITTNKRHANGTPYHTGPIYRYQYSNHLGSACLELDHSAEIISYEEYHPYGTSAYRTMKSGIEAPPKRYRYTGKERDEETGLYYHGARYYAAWLGRWCSPDPANTADGLNLFAYCRGAPTQLVDLRGRQGDRPKVSDADVTAVKMQFALQSWSSLQMASISMMKLTDPIMGFAGEFVHKRFMAAIGSPVSEDTEQDVDAASWNPVQSAMTNFSLAEERSGRAVEALKAGNVDVAKREAAMAGASYGRHLDALGAVIGLSRAGAGLLKGLGEKLAQGVSRGASRLMQELSRGLPFSAQRAMTRAIERSIRFERLLAHLRKGKVNEIMFEYAFKNADPAFFGGTEFAKRTLKTGAGKTIYTGPGAKEGARYTDVAMAAKTEGGAPAKSGLELKARYGDKITDPLEEAVRGEAAKQLGKEAKAAEMTHGDVRWGPNAKGALDPYVPGEGGTGVGTGWPVWLNWKPGWLPN